MAQSVAAQFAQASVDWQSAMQADEWFFARLREQLIDSLTASEAFESVGGVAEFILREPDSDLRYEAGSLLIALARHSDTTEIPPALARAWDLVMERLRKVQADQLASWYRKSFD